MKHGGESYIHYQACPVHLLSSVCVVVAMTMAVFTMLSVVGTLDGGVELTIQ